uniref:Fungal lipase-type domain-containing protein n=1 Tax=Arcella intermedia TaxID=1963864 RepID=A0A6B2LE72_9EUKA
MTAFATYCPASSLYSWNCFWCNASNVQVIGVIYNSSTDTSGYVGIDKGRNEIVVAFRGTVKTSITNWITDLTFVLTNPYLSQPTIEVHEGFWVSYRSIEDQFILALRKAMTACPGCTKTVYTGHSLGGALAAIALMDAVYYYKIGHPSPILYTFGQPRTGNPAWATWMQGFSNSTTRVVHDKDIVPHLPPTDFGYHHMAYEVWMEDGSSVPYVVCNSSGEDQSCSDGEIAISIPDHLLYLGYQQDEGKNHGCF